MGAQQRVYKKRIRSAQGMQKIFKAMEMISAARISKAHARVEATTPYAQAITQAVAAVATHSRDAGHPFLSSRQVTGRAGILLITSDRGMAGSYSSNVIREAERLINTLTIDKGKEVVLYTVGRKGLSYFTFREHPVEQAWAPYAEDELVALGREVSQRVQHDLLSEDPEVHIDELFIVGTRFLSRFTQEARTARLVPLEIVDADPASDDGTPPPLYPLYEFAPDPHTVLDALLPRYVESRIINILMQSVASEHAARQRAMSTAADNAETQIRKFVRLANTARQAEITQEITEIVGGADALAGSGRKER
ncbi:F0F1 ATP synthase subunit gamma [Devriesea agamarum]|uniref:F0F1 ATP synthase subunit gamma n=1 Tax=Devriesea agamarum TaxID=472569 RepID=UPI00071C62D0|nr:F0F1 ATP synthase subunit gamma [Devriesea agamarum]